MAYMEQVKKLAQNDSTHRSELSTTIARNATEENDLVYHFSTTDAIAVPYMKMDLEKNRREYRHAPIPNILTRKLEEARTVIFGRDIDLESDDDIMQEVLVACLHRYPKVQGSPVVGHRTRDEGEGYPSNSPRIMPWIDCWDIIHRVEVDPSIQNIHDTVSKIQSGSEMRDLISMIMRHTRMAYPLLNIVDERSMEVLGGRLVDRWECQPIEVVLDMWDFDLWRPLPEDVEWDIKWQSGGWCLCRERFIRGKQYKYGGVHLEVDENGNMLDTLENQQRIEGESIQEQPKSRFLKMLRKLKI
ncbi:hypothetical protein FRC17_005298 [Serendipita sp. 399]|nr:hypothetical protein FRC17_005298 [Serendipita sp. 399]